MSEEKKPKLAKGAQLELEGAVVSVTRVEASPFGVMRRHAGDRITFDPVFTVYWQKGMKKGSAQIVGGGDVEVELG